jgi:hypothetical protein
MIHKEVILRDVEIPDGYEPTGEYRVPSDNETFLPCVRIILRKVPVWRDPVLPADAGKLCRYWNDGSWYTAKLVGWLNDSEPWKLSTGGECKTCQVCDD